jgi:hypothetical protein
MSREYILTHYPECESEEVIKFAMEKFDLFIEMLCIGGRISRRIAKNKCGRPRRTASIA